MVGLAAEAPMRPQAERAEDVVKDSDEKKVVETIMNNARTGSPGDGKIFVMNCEEVVGIRTGKRGSAAI